MGASLNRVFLIGHLGKDVELRHTTADGKAVANFSIATTSKSGGKDVTEWHNIVVWDKLAENCAQYLSKGKLAYVEGRIATRVFEKNLTKHYVTEIIASTVQFLSSSTSPSPTDYTNRPSIASPAPQQNFAQDDLTAF